MKSSGNLKRRLLYLLIASVVVGAILGIVIVLRGTWTWFEVRVIFTSVILAVSSVCGLACNLARSPHGKAVLPNAGLILTAIAASLSLIGMWSEIESEAYWKTTGAAVILAIATVQICLLSVAKLASRFQWVFVLTFQVAYGLAILLIVMIFAEIENEGMFRLIGVVSIVDASLTLVIPILHRISRFGSREEALVSPLGEHSIVAIDAEIATLQKRIEQLKTQRAKIQDS